MNKQINKFDYLRTLGPPRTEKFHTLVAAVKYTKSLLPKRDTKSFIALPKIYK